MKLKIQLFLFALCLMYSTSSFALIDSGTCGTCYWEIDDEGTLTIGPSNGVSGELDEWDYSPAWCSSSTIKKAVIKRTVIAKTCYRMFNDCYNMVSVDLEGLVTDNVTDMSFMFWNCRALTSLDLSNFKTDNVVTMNSMFLCCENLNSLDIYSFNTENVTDMGNMFCLCYSLSSLDVSNFKTDNVTSMNNMFQSCSGLTSLDVSKFNPSLMLY